MRAAAAPQGSCSAYSAAGASAGAVAVKTVSLPGVWGGQQPVALQPRGRAAAARHGAGGQARRKALQAVRIQRGGGQGPAALQQRAGQRPVGGRLLHERRMARAEGQDVDAVGGKAGCV